MGIFDAFTFQEQDLSLAELSRRLKVHRSTLHRLLLALCRYRLLEQNPRTRRFRLGLRLFELGNQAVAGVQLREVARPHLRELTAETGETSHLVVLDEGEALYLEKFESSNALRMPSRVGRRVPAHCTAVGKVLLAHLPEQELDGVLQARGLGRFTAHTLTTPQALKAELRRIRERGYAVDNEEIEEGLRCVGAPVRNYTGEVVGSVSIAGPSSRLTWERLPQLEERVMACAAAISRDLGGHISEALMTTDHGLSK